ncbi:phage gene 29 protein family protein [Nocardia rhizosphaerae]|uniref:DUF2744 domain-containing protein n=1 Tax=Nocardia rhizosphaerae TaxID=1691571 RepID=A0ABV8L6T7_9NOCA
MPLPLQHECNPNDPEDAFLWALVGLPGPRNGPLLVPQQVLGKWSKHLWDLGFRHHPEEQTLEYHPADPAGEHWLAQSGNWVPVGTPRPVRESVPTIRDLPVAARRELVRQLREAGDLAEPVPDRTDGAQAGSYEAGTP